MWNEMRHLKQWALANVFMWASCGTVWGGGDCVSALTTRIDESGLLHVWIGSRLWQGGKSTKCLVIIMTKDWMSWRWFIKLHGSVSAVCAWQDLVYIWGSITIKKNVTLTLQECVLLNIKASASKNKCGKMYFSNVIAA